MNSLFPSMKGGSKNKMSSTQMYLKVAEIHDDTVILKNGGLRAVLRTSSINLNLKSEEEQNAVIYGYQNFLNSLEFPIQIHIKSKKLDLDHYIEKLKRLGVNQTNPLLQKQTFEYTEYISKIIDYADIMQKEFYVIVPQEATGKENRSTIQRFIEAIRPEDPLQKIQARQKKFSELEKKLSGRINTIIPGLEACGLQVERLKTPELIQLFYSTYNPNTARIQKIEHEEDLAMEMDKEISQAPEIAETKKAA